MSSPDEMIPQICAEHGLQLASHRRDGPLLELQPISLDQLPSTQQFDLLCQRLRQHTGLRYITLALDDPAHERP